MQTRQAANWQRRIQWALVRFSRRNYEGFNSGTLRWCPKKVKYNYSNRVEPANAPMMKKQWLTGLVVSEDMSDFIYPLRAQQGALPPWGSASILFSVWKQILGFRMTPLEEKPANCVHVSSGNTDINKKYKVFPQSCGQRNSAPELHKHAQMQRAKVIIALTVVSCQVGQRVRNDVY